MRLPEGLLSFLSLQSEGRNPDLLGDVVQPVLDQREFYESSQIITQSAPVSVVATGNATGTNSVPPNEIWIVTNLSLIANWAGGALHSSVNSVVQPGGVIHLLNTTSLPVATAGEALANWDGRFIARPGFVFGAYTSISGLGATTMQQNISYIPIKI